MNLNDWEKIWRRQDLPVGPDADLAKLMQTFEERHRKLDRTLATRDWREARASVYVAVAFTWIGLKTPGPVWPFASAVALVLGMTGFFIRERLRANRLRPGLDVPIRRKIEADLAELRRQRWLLKNVAVWYLAPIFLAMILVGIGTRLGRPLELQRGPVFYGATILVAAFLFWFGWLINQKAVRKQIDPRLAELEKLHQALCEDP